MTAKLVARLKIAETLLAEAEEKTAALEKGIFSLAGEELEKAKRQLFRNRIRLASLEKKFDKLKSAQPHTAKKEG